MSIRRAIARVAARTPGTKRHWWVVSLEERARWLERSGDSFDLRRAEFLRLVAFDLRDGQDMELFGQPIGGS